MKVVFNLQTQPSWSGYLLVGCVRPCVCAGVAWRGVAWRGVVLRECMCCVRCGAVRCGAVRCGAVRCVRACVCVCVCAFKPSQVCVCVGQKVRYAPRRRVEAQINQTFWQDIPGSLGWDIQGVLERFLRKKMCSIFAPYVLSKKNRDFEVFLGNWLCEGTFGSIWPNFGPDLHSAGWTWPIFTYFDLFRRPALTYFDL